MTWGLLFSQTGARQTTCHRSTSVRPFELASGTRQTVQAQDCRRPDLASQSRSRIANRAPGVTPLFARRSARRLAGVASTTAATWRDCAILSALPHRAATGRSCPERTAACAWKQRSSQSIGRSVFAPFARAKAVLVCAQRGGLQGARALPFCCHECMSAGRDRSMENKNQEAILVVLYSARYLLGSCQGARARSRHRPARQTSDATNETAARMIPAQSAARQVVALGCLASLNCQRQRGLSRRGPRGHGPAAQRHSIDRPTTRRARAGGGGGSRRR